MRHWSLTAVPLQWMEPIARRYAQIGELERRMDGFELPERAPRHVGGHLLDFAGAKQFLGLAIGEALDHPEV